MSSGVLPKIATNRKALVISRGYARNPRGPNAGRQARSARTRNRRIRRAGGGGPRGRRGRRPKGPRKDLRSRTWPGILKSAVVVRRSVLLAGPTSGPFFFADVWGAKWLAAHRRRTGVDIPVALY